MRATYGVAVGSALLLAAMMSGSTWCVGRGRGPAVTWKQDPREVRYALTETLPDGTVERAALVLRFASNGVAVEERGSAVQATMAPTGRLTLARAADPPVIYELPALAVLPPGNAGPVVGQSWSVLRPDDAEAAASDAVVGQERFTYTVTGVTDTVIEVSVEGDLRMAPSRGLDKLLADATPLPAAMVRPLATGWSKYLVGTARFDRAAGSTVAASGTRVPFAVLDAASDPASHPRRRAYALDRQ